MSVIPEEKEFFNFNSFRDLFSTLEKENCPILLFQQKYKKDGSRQRDNLFLFFVFYYLNLNKSEWDPETSDSFLLKSLAVWYYLYPIHFTDNDQLKNFIQQYLTTNKGEKEEEEKVCPLPLKEQSREKSKKSSVILPLKEASKSTADSGSKTFTPGKTKAYLGSKVDLLPPKRKKRQKGLEVKAKHSLQVKPKLI